MICELRLPSRIGQEASEPKQRDDIRASVPQRSLERWIAGHQLTIIAWAVLGLLKDKTGQLLASDVHPSELIRIGTTGLVYACAITPETYAAEIRPHMHAAHPGFSGTWSWEYQQVREIYLASDELPTKTISAVQEFWQQHADAMMRLVGGGLSLNQMFEGQPPSDAYSVYDNFFVVRRCPTDSMGLLTQMAVLAQTLASDNEVNGSMSDDRLHHLSSVAAAASAIANAQELDMRSIPAEQSQSLLGQPNRQRRDGSVG